MTSHELARKLLEMPDLPVVVQDGMDPSDWKVVEEVYTSKEGDYFWQKTGFGTGNHIILE